MSVVCGIINIYFSLRLHILDTPLPFGLIRSELTDSVLLTSCLTLFCASLFLSHAHNALRDQMPTSNLRYVRGYTNRVRIAVFWAALVLSRVNSAHALTYVAEI
jgi:hypothetical protein